MEALADLNAKVLADFDRDGWRGEVIDHRHMLEGRPTGLAFASELRGPVAEGSDRNTGVPGELLEGQPPLVPKLEQAAEEVWVVFGASHPERLTRKWPRKKVGFTRRLHLY